MTETYMFPDSPVGLTLAMQVAVSLRRNGFRTRLVPVTIAGFVLHKLLATPQSRPTRRERGLLNTR